MSEAVYKATVEKGLERLALLWRVSSNLLLALDVVDILFVKCDIQIARQNDWLALALLECLKVFMELCVPVVDAVIKSLQLVTGIWHVSSYQNEVAELHSNGPAFSGMLSSEVELHRKWLDLRDDGSARIAQFCLAAVPVAGIPGRQLQEEFLFVDLLWVSLDLVEAEYIWVDCVHELLQSPFLEHSCPVDVPLVDFCLRVSEVVLACLASHNNRHSKAVRDGEE